jgi:DNA polymerase-3 subunit gamma/tau
MSLYQKYRPQSLDEVVGNAVVVASLRSPKIKDSHAHLFHGGAGCGKTTMGRLLAKELGAVGTDYQELDSADFRGIDTIRTIRRQVDFKPASGKCRVWLLDEAHQITNDAANALLKVLEEPPAHAYFILCTTAPQKLLPTIKSRCSEHAVAPLDEADMVSLLRRVVKGEAESLERALYQQIARESLGHPRKALTILEKVLGVPPEQRAEAAAQAAVAVSQTIELCRALIEPSPSWKKVSRILTGLGEEEPESIRRAVLGYCTSVAMKGDMTKVGLVMEEFINPFYDTGRPQLVLACMRVCAG